MADKTSKQEVPRSNINESIEPGRALDAMLWMAASGKEPNLFKCRFVDGEFMPHAGHPVGHISPPHYSSSAGDMFSLLDTLDEVYLEKRDGLWFVMIADDFSRIGEDKSLLLAASKALLAEYT